MKGSSRLIVAIVAVAVWAAITVIGGLVQAGQGSLGSLVSRQVTLATPLAALFLLVVAWRMGWNDIGLNGPRPRSSSWLLWPVAIYIVFFATIGLINHQPTAHALIFVAINTAFVGFSEELAFRGILWGAARKTLPFWTGVLLVSGLFGAIHLLNVFITGELSEAAIQALNAFISGFGYLAMRIRTRSIWPIIIGHWLWDFSIFLSSADPTKAAQATTAGNPLYGLALVAPIALYGLWLLRTAEYRRLDDDFEGRSTR
ncbi:MAG: lysostaphin resistance A-like protein [Sphingomonadaceae bacterium]